MTQERLLDTTALEAPQPLQQALEAVDALQPGDYLRLRTSREPVFLYPLLTVQGFDYQRQIHGQTYELLIWRHGDEIAIKALESTKTAMD